MNLNFYQYSFDSVDYGPLDIKDPVNFEDLEVDANRDLKTHGVFFDISKTSFQFWGEARDYLKTAFEAKGVEAIVNCTIKETCDGGITFEEIISGTIDFTKKEETLSSPCLFIVPVVDNSCLVNLQKKADQKVVIPTATTITIPSKNIRKTTNIYQKNEDGSDFDRIGVETTIVPAHAVGPVNSIKAQTVIVFMNIPDVIYEDVLQYDPQGVSPGGFGYDPNIYKTFQATEDGVHNFDVSFELESHAFIQSSAEPNPLTGGSFTNYKLEFFYMNPAGVSTLLTTLSNNTPVAEGVPKTIGVHTTVSDPARSVSMVAGDTVCWYFVITTEADFTAHDNTGTISIDHFDYLKIFDLQSAFNVTLLSSFPTTQAKVSMIDIVFDTIVKSITNNCIALLSDFFGRTDGVGSHGVDGCAGLNCVTTGIHVRQITNPDKAKLSMSLQQSFEDMSSIYNLGMGVKKILSQLYLIIEPARYFYDTNVVLTFDNVPNIKVRFDETLCANKLSIGYNQWESEITNGQDEIMTKREFGNDLPIKNELSKYSELIASNYATELARRVGNTSEDFKYDSNNFIYCLKRSGGSLIVEQGNIDPSTEFAFIDYASGYNYAISPARNARRWFKSVMIGVKNYLTENLKFKYGENNAIAKSKLTSGCAIETAGTLVSENGDITAASINVDDREPILSGEIIEAEVPFTTAQLQLLKANPEYLISVRPDDSGPYISGWVKTVSFKKKDKKAVLTLLKQI